jgi:Crossover junction endodeoxyribonuclease RuvC
VDTHHPDVIAIERVFAQQNVSTVMGTAQAGGVVAVAAAKRDIDVHFHTPTEVKAAVTGNGEPARRNSPPWSPESLACKPNRHPPNSGASALTVADSSASSSDSSSESLDDFLAGILGSNGSSNLTEAGGTAIGIGGAGGDGGNGAVLFPTDYDVNTADLSTTQSASLDGFLDSLLGSGDSSAVAGQAGSTVTDATSVSIDGSGGAGGSGAEFFPITLD